VIFTILSYRECDFGKVYDADVWRLGADLARGPRRCRRANSKGDGMDANHVGQLTQALSAPGTRRRVLRWLGMLPLVGTGAVMTAPAGATAAATQTSSSSVPIFRGNPARTGEMPGPGPAGAPVQLWRFAASGPVASSPAVADGGVYVGSSDGHLYAVDRATGAERWRVATGGSVFSSPAAVVGLVYVGNDGGVLFAVDAATGTERWRFETEDSTRSSPAVLDGVVYVGSDDGHLYALADAA
jgi:hypothetical protein